MIIRDTFDRAPLPDIAWADASDEELVDWALLGNADAGRELVGRSTKDGQRFNPNHDNKGKFTGGSASNKKFTGLTPDQYTAITPDHKQIHYDDEVTFAAREALSETQQGRDVLRVADDFQESYKGVDQIQDDVFDTIHGKGPGGIREERAQALLDVSRNLPPGTLPPRVYRGMNFDKADMAEFKESWKPGAEVDLGPSSFSEFKDVARDYATSERYGRFPVVVESSTKGMQALPLHNLSDTTMFPVFEVIGMGRFRVDSAVQNGDRYEVKVEPIGVF